MSGIQLIGTKRPRSQSLPTLFRPSFKFQSLRLTTALTSTLEQLQFINARA